MTTELSEEIENWKLEVKREQSERYFYHTRLAEKLAVSLGPSAGNMVVKDAIRGQSKSCAL